MLTPGPAAAVIVDINTSDPRPIYVQIVDEIRRGIVIGALRSDDPLPSVRQLASELRVNPNTVQQAYRELERDGIVYVQRGQGTFVANSGVPAAERSGLLHEVAARAVRDAYRHGFTVAELVTAINREDGA